MTTETGTCGFVGLTGAQTSGVCVRPKGHGPAPDHVCTGEGGHLTYLLPEDRAEARSGTTVGYTPTDEDVHAVAGAMYEAEWRPLGSRWRDIADESDRDYWIRQARIVLATIGPIFERERRAAKAEALREFADLLDSRYPTDKWPELDEYETPLLLDRADASMGRVVARSARREADAIERDA